MMYPYVLGFNQYHADFDNNRIIDDFGQVTFFNRYRTSDDIVVYECIEEGAYYDGTAVKVLEQLRKRWIADKAREILLGDTNKDMDRT